MKIPQVTCTIEAYSEVNPSEDSEKVQQAISNVLLDAESKVQDSSIKSTSKSLESLSKIYDVIRSRKTAGAFRRQMKNNLYGNSTWFYLNKQAAFVNVVALCENADESPLGPIKIIIKSNNVEDVIDWLVRQD